MYLKSTEKTMEFIQLEFTRQQWPTWKSFADDADIKSPATVSRMMNGDTRFPRHETIVKMLRALGYRIAAHKYATARNVAKKKKAKARA